MRAVRYDRFYTYDDLTGTLRAWADEAPRLVELDSIGQSYEGREIWIATITNLDTGPAAEKPAFLVEANIHAIEVTSCTAALHLIHRLLSGYGNDANVTRALDTRAFYVIPRLNPDGSELALADRPRFLRSSVRPWPRLDPQDGLYEEDVDGDGRILFMRVRDANGAWRVAEEDARLLVPRGPLETEGEFYRLLPEGRIRNFDGVTIKTPPPLEGLDLNRNFPMEWGTESEQLGAGPFPTSEPEVRALVQAVVDRPNLVGYIAYHTFSGVHLRPYSGYDDERFPTADLRAFKLIGDEATRLTGYPTVSIYHEFKYDPKQTIKGGADDWVYDHLGAFAWTTEFWSPQRQAGLDGYHYIEWLREHPIEDELAIVHWFDEHYPGRAYVDWYPFDHPELGPIELGGWDLMGFWANVPFDRLEAEVAPHADFALFHLLISPLLEEHSLDVERVGEGAWRIRLVLLNTGWLPTNVTEKAVERKAVRPLEIELTLPEGARLAAGERITEAGQLAGRVHKRSALWWGNDESTSDRIKLEWVVEAAEGAEVGIEARHQRAGTLRRLVELR
ncbi:MAG TPA: M14 family metallopeptidase [Gaiellaceae bacterium]